MNLSQMPVSERLRLLEEVWASLADRPEALEIPDWHRRELDSRLAEHRDNPSAARPWSGVKTELSRPSHK